MNAATGNTSALDVNRGVLGKLPGDLIGAGASMCPDPSTTTAESHRVEVQSIYGLVAITYQLKRQTRWRRFFWTAIRADLIAACDNANG